MSYQILPNIIFILAVLGIIVLILRHLPEATALQNSEPKELSPDQKLLAKGLPAQAFNVIKVKLSLWTKKTWHFILEAKDLRPQAAAGYKMKKIFGGRLPGIAPVKTQPLTTQEVRNEQYYLDQIKLEPKNLIHYDALGKFYLEKESYTDAQDIFHYLVNHQPSSPDYHARLGYCYYQTGDFAKAAASYQKSLDLDSTQPNRYYNLGLSLESAGQHKQAGQALQKALELEPQNPKYQTALKKIKKPA